MIEIIHVVCRGKQRLLTRVSGITLADRRIVLCMAVILGGGGEGRSVLECWQKVRESLDLIPAPSKINK